MHDIHIRQEIDCNKLYWPIDEDCEEESGLGMNRDYFDLRGLSFDDVAPLIESEKKFAIRAAECEDYDEIEEELYENTNYYYHECFFGLDPGVASSVVALSAFGCIPFTSCNAGAFGGNHPETIPLVGFFARPEHIPQLLEAARECQVGLVNDRSDAGAVVLFAENVAALQTFASYVATRHREMASSH